MIIKRLKDNSYVIIKNNLPYHVPNEGEFAEEWLEVDNYAQLYPDDIFIETPDNELIIDELEILLK